MSIMAVIQDMPQEITCATIEGQNAAVQVMAVTRNEVGTKLRSKSIGMGPKLDGLKLKQPTFS